MDNHQQQQQQPTTPTEGWNWTSCQQAQLAMVQNPSRFPQKLREAIEANQRWDPERFCFVIYQVLKSALLWGATHHPRNNASNTNPAQQEQEWAGFDGRIDTEAQLEAAIRIFPQVLDETVVVWMGQGDQHCYTPLRSALLSPYTLGFVPLLAELGKELSRDRQISGRGGHGLMDCSLTYFAHSEHPKPGTPLLELVASEFLLANRKDQGDDEDSAETAVVATTAAKALARLQDSGLLKVGDIRICMYTLLRYKWPCSKTMLRTLVEWDPPSLTENLIDPWSSLLMKHLYSYNFYDWKTLDKRRELGIFEVLFEMGLKFYPEEAGNLLMSKDLRKSIITNDPYGPCYRHYAADRRARPLDIACAVCGRQEVMEMVDRVLSRFVIERPHEAVAMMVRASSESHKIGLDALYLLCRRDPNDIASSSGWMRRVLVGDDNEVEEEQHQQKESESKTRTELALYGMNEFVRAIY